MRFISRNTRPPERRPHGLTLDDVRGLIRKPVSYWAIDESGNPSRKPKENGKPFTLSAVTELSPIDYDRLLEGVPLYDGEVHFNKLRNEHPDICISLMTNFGNESILILYKTVFKNAKSTASGRIKGQPIDELYLLSLLNEMIEAILSTDYSDVVLITYDRSNNIKEETCTLLWNERCILVMGESNVYRLIQMADLSASSIGKALLPHGFADDTYFDKIRMKSINIRENRSRPQLNSAFLPQDNRDSKYLTDSEPAKKGSRISKNVKNLQECQDRKKSGGLAGCTQHPAFTHTTDVSPSDYKNDKQSSKRSSSKKRRCIPRS